MSEYKRRCLYRIKTENGLDAPSMLESVWAYSFTYAGASTSTPGRYRIRVSKFLGEEAYRMFGIDDPSQIENSENMFSLQAYLEKWTNDGWIQCLDWVGNPDDTTDKIESDLNEMYQAFVTGVSLGKDIITPVFTPNKPPKKPKQPPHSRAAGTPSSSSKSDDQFEWI